MLESRDNAAEAYEHIQKDLLSVPNVKRQQHYSFTKKMTDMKEQYFEENITTKTLLMNPIESRIKVRQITPSTFSVTHSLIATQSLHP